MANRKQDGSNILSWEYSTGVCPTQCEECFCNLGMQGQSVTASFISPKNKEWQEYAKKERKRRGLSLPASRITPTLKGLQNIPRSAALRESWYKRRQRTIRPAGYDVDCIPFLRISSMSDCSYYPPEVIEHLRDTWGEYGFFNTAIRSFLKRPENVADRAHKVVVTTNPGRQKIVAPGVRNRQQVILASLAGSGGKYGFLTPKTFTDVGYSHLEKKVKFYRLRAMPTIIPHIETDQPVVITQLRFRTLFDAAAWAKRYNVECRIEGTLTQKIAALLKQTGAKVKIQNGQATRIFLRTTDRRNASDFAGDWSVYAFEDAWWRPDLSIQAWDWVDSSGLTDFVCDRIHKACEACGLCANLDGTVRDWHNKLNLVDGEPVPLKRGEAYYLYHFAPRENPEMANEYYEDQLELVWDGESIIPISKLDAENLLAAVADYLDPEVYTCDGWNTHEKVATLANAVAFSRLMQGASPEEVKKLFSDQGVPILGIVDPETLLDGTSDFCNMFGEIK